MTWADGLYWVEMLHPMNLSPNYIFHSLLVTFGLVIGSGVIKRDNVNHCKTAYFLSLCNEIETESIV